MKSYNHVVLVGHLAANPETKVTKNGRNVTNFPIAINRNAIDDKGEKKEIADYHRVIAWQKLGDVCSKYLTKGMPVLIHGRLVNSVYDEDGKKHYSTEIIAENLRMLNSKRSKTGNAEVSIESVKEMEEVEAV